MSTRITLDEINDAVEAQYGSLDIELPFGLLKLRNPLRLTKAERKALFDLQDESKAEDAEGDAEDMLVEMIGIIAEDKAVAGQFLDHYGHDLAKINFILRRYTEQVKLGEA